MMWKNNIENATIIDKDEVNHLRTNFVVQTDSLLKKELSVGCFSLVVTFIAKI